MATAATTKAQALDRQALLGSYQRVRQATEALCAPLEVEDYVVQTMSDVSPAKWHLGHTTWFFEKVLLEKFVHGYAPDRAYSYIFNSYYETFGARQDRARRGWLSRPTVKEVYDYRARVDERVAEFIRTAKESELAEAAPYLTLGEQHEQQHQELLIADLKHVFATNPLKPVYCDRRVMQQPPTRKEPRFMGFEGGLRRLGADGQGFAYDNERPAHRAYVHEFELAERCVTNGEFMAFIADGGYEEPRLWLSDGWDLKRREGWTAPLYWQEHGDEEWLTATMSGLRAIEPAEPVIHVSYYEASAYAEWAGMRLPTEYEWESASLELGRTPEEGCFLEDLRFHPFQAGTGFWDLLGNCWEWTQSAYLPYPGYKAYEEALHEYNGKFMCGQFVLRGGSCATPSDHVRPTYRNFFQPEKRWQFSGFRLAR